MLWIPFISDSWIIMAYSGSRLRCCCFRGIAHAALRLRGKEGEGDIWCGFMKATGVIMLQQGLVSTSSFTKAMIASQKHHRYKLQPALTTTDERVHMPIFPINLCTGLCCEEGVGYYISPSKTPPGDNLGCKHGQYHPSIFGFHRESLHRRGSYQIQARGAIVCMSFLKTHRHGCLTLIGMFIV